MTASVATVSSNGLSGEAVSPSATRRATSAASKCSAPWATSGSSQRRRPPAASRRVNPPGR